MEVPSEEKGYQDGRKPHLCRRVFTSLRCRLLLLILLVAIPALGLTVSTILAWKRHERAEAEAYILMLARIAAQHQEHVFRTSHGLLLGLAQVMEGREGKEAACQRFLASFQRAFPSSAPVGVVQREGSIACGSLPGQGPASLKDHPLFGRVMDTRRFALGERRVDPVTGRAAMRFAGPIFDGAGSIQAVGFGDLDMGWLANLMRTPLWPAGATATLIDRDGIVAAREPNSQDWVGRTASAATVFQTVRHARSEDTAFGVDLDGSEKLFGFMPLQGPLFEGNLLMVLSLPVMPAFAEANNILVRNLVALGGTLLLVILLAWVGSSLFVLRRVDALVAMARRLMVGDLAARSGVPHGPGELNLLAGAFDAMAADLEKRQSEADRSKEALGKVRDELDRRVQERTADLTKANAALQQTLLDLRQAEESLRENEAQLAAIIGSATDGIIAIDENYRVLLFNQAAERIFRLPAARAIGQPADQLVPERFRGLFHRITRGGGTIGPQCGRLGSAAGLRADGEEFPVEAATSMVAIRGKSLYTIILRDITERQRREETLRKLSRAVEQTAESVYITNRDGVIEYVNPAFESQTGYAREEVIGQTSRILKSGAHDREFYEQLWKTILAGRVFQDVFTNRKKNGEIYYDLQTITPIRDDQGAISHFVASGRDITDRRRTEAALQRLNAQLEKEAERIAHALHDDAGQFLTAAHIAVADAARGLPPGPQERLREVRGHLDQIEEQLRSMSRELRPRVLEDLGLPAALKFLADGVTKRTGIAVGMEDSLKERLPPIVETTLYRLIQEALTNASRHARGTRIAVRIVRDGRGILCEIRDDGIGFNVPEIFERQGDSSLGLLGIRDRLEALGGTVQIKSAPGQGTEIVVRIPLEY